MVGIGDRVGEMSGDNGTTTTIVPKCDVLVELVHFAGNTTLIDQPVCLMSYDSK